MTEPRDLTVPNTLLIDMETSGLYRDDLPPTDPAQPWAMQLAFALCNESGAMSNFGCHIIKAEGRTAKENAVKVHGISARVTSQIGVPEPRVLGMLADLLKTLPMTGMRVVTYGDFDRKVITSLFARFGESQGRSGVYDRLWARRPSTEFINLMDPWCTQACKLKSDFEDGSYKWPSLDEAALHILGRQPRVGFHDAWQDMLIMRDLYLHFLSTGAIQRGAA